MRLMMFTVKIKAHPSVELRVSNILLNHVSILNHFFFFLLLPRYQEVVVY